MTDPARHPPDASPRPSASAQRPSGSAEPPSEPQLLDLPGRDPGLPRFAIAAAILAVLAAGWVLLRPAAAPPGVLGTAVEIAAGTPETTFDQSGATIFLAQGCGACHGSTSASTALGPGLGGVGARAAARVLAADYTGSATDASGYLEEAIVDHCVDLVPSYSCVELPDLGLRLSTTDAVALVDFLTRLPAEGTQ